MMYAMEHKFTLFFYAVSDVVIGLQQTTYSITEDDGIVFVCTTVVSGRIAGRTITTDYQTADGDAEGTALLCL